MSSMESLNSPQNSNEKQAARHYSFAASSSTRFEMLRLWPYIVSTANYSSIIFSVICLIPITAALRKADSTERPFHSNDSSIGYPVGLESVPFTVACIGVIPAAIAFFVQEIILTKRINPSASTVNARRRAFNLTLDLIANCFIVYCATISVKKAAGILRPDFLARCNPSVTINATTCLQTDQEYLEEGKESYPSGHVSQSFAISIYFTLYLMHRWYYLPVPNRLNSTELSWSAQLKQQLLQMLDMLILIIPTIAAGAISISRIVDYRHRPSDVNGGFIVAFIFSFLYYFRLVGLGLLSLDQP